MHKMLALQTGMFGLLKIFNEEEKTDVSKQTLMDIDGWWLQSLHKYFALLFPPIQLHTVLLAGDLGMTNSNIHWGKDMAEQALHSHRGVAFSLAR